MANSPSLKLTTILGSAAGAATGQGRGWPRPRVATKLHVVALGPVCVCRGVATRSLGGIELAELWPAVAIWRAFDGVAGSGRRSHSVSKHDKASGSTSFEDRRRHVTPALGALSAESRLCSFYTRLLLFLSLIFGFELRSGPPTSVRG